MIRTRMVAGACGAFLAASLAFALPPAVSAAPLHPKSTAVHGTVGKVVDPRTARPIAAHFWTHGPLLRDGKYSGSELASSMTVGHKATPGTTVSPNSRVVSANFDGLNQSSPGCTCAGIPQANSAVGTSNIVEVVQNELAVYSKTGTPQLSVDLNTLLGTANTLAFPRIIYDPLWNRWAISVEGLAPTTSDYPQIWTLVSNTADPAGSWYVSHVDIYWAGANGIADFPTIGMDRDSLLLSSNNFSYDSGSATYSYLSSTAYAIPKAIIYNGSSSWNSLVFFVAFGTVPAIVTGNPTPDAAKTYLIGTDLAADVVHIYSLENSAHYGRQKFLTLPNAAYAFDPPARRVNQPGTGTTLDPGDGRINSAPSQAGSRVWFANGIDLQGFPAVEYGFVTTGVSPAAHVATAFHSSTSDDFDPSIAVLNDAGGKAHGILMWTYTDAPTNVPVHDTWDSVVGGPGHKSGFGYSPVGGSTSTGEMGTVSAVALDYSPPCGTSAVVTGQYFAASGAWRTRIAEVGIC